jgi:biopolymer transport protein ExbB
MKFVKSIGLTLATASLCIFGLPALAQQQAASLDQLLELIEQAKLNETEEQRARVQAFEQNASQRQAMLDEMSGRRAEEEAISAQLEAQYNENEVIKAQRFETLQERKGDLTELFGTINGVVNDTRSTFEQSLIPPSTPVAMCS